MCGSGGKRRAGGGRSSLGEKNYSYSWVWIIDMLIQIIAILVMLTTDCGRQPSLVIHIMFRC